jgi:hypothetical protein
MEVHKNSCANLEPRSKWAQSILPTVDDLVDDPTNPRRTRFQLEGDLHALVVIEEVISMHCYMVLASDPQAYVDAKENMYWKTSINDEDLDILPSNSSKWIDMNISLVNLHHQVIH